MKSRDYWLVTLVLLAAAAFRLCALQDVPPGLAQDEVLDADIANGILAGRHALFFREGWGHEPLYHYLGAVFQVLLGDNFLSIRLPAVFSGLLVVALAFTCVRRPFGLGAALGTSAGLAVSWWPVVFSRVGIRPISEPAVLLVAVLAFQRAVAGGRRSGRWWALCGLALGLTFYTYTAARVLPVLFVVAVAHLLVFRREMVRGHWVALGGAGLLALLVVSPLLVTLRIHPELQERVGQLGGPMDALRAGDLAPVAGSAWDTVRGLVWGGDPRWTYTLPNRPVFEALGAVLFLTGLLVAVWRWRSARFFFVLAWLVVGLVPSMLSPDAPSLNRMVGAMPVVYLFPALVPRWLANRFRGGGKIGFGLLGVWLAITAGWTVRDGFVRWPAATETRWKYQTILLEIARDIQSQPETVPVVVDSWFDPIDESSLRRNLGSDVAVRWAQAGAAVVYPVGGEGRLYVPEFAAMAGSLIETGSVPSSPLYRSAGIPSYAVYALSASPAAPADVTRVAVGDVATFLGFRLLDRQGPTVELITRWRVDAALPADLAIFVHLLAADASIVAQSDGLDVAATTLRPGDEFVQLSLLSLSEPQLACPCLLQVGMYRRGDGSRLAIPGHPDDRIILVRDLCR